VCLEHNYIIDILAKHHIQDYHRYVDDILLIYNEDITNINNTLEQFNQIHPNIQFTIEKEKNNTINYLDISITKSQNKFTFDIYRKPTTTDLIIHNESCHPREHKHTAIKYLTDRMNTYPISPNKKHREQQNINTILKNNKYPQYTHTKNNNNNNRNTNTERTTQKTKWATFTYIGKETRTITRLFINTNIKIAYKTNNTIQKYLQPQKPNTDIYNNSGIYLLSCNDCPLQYVGQTGRNFKTTYKEHIQAIRNNKPNSKYAQHILDTQHTYSTIENTMRTLQIQKKGQVMNTLERYHIYRITKDGRQMNDTYSETYNPIFNIINNYYTKLHK
jgi:hypothetical protein